MSAMCQKEGCPKRIGIGLVYTIEGAIEEFQGFNSTLFLKLKLKKWTIRCIYVKLICLYIF